MDDQRFDALTKGLAGRLTRRSAWQGALGGLVGVVGLTAGAGDADAQGRNRRVRAQHCLADGAVCRPADPSKPNRQGTQHRHRCRQCCSRFSVQVGRGRKCACRPEGMPGNRSQCCSGVVRGGRCALPAVTQGLFEQYTGPGRLTSPNPLTKNISGPISGSHIIGTYTGTVTLSNVRANPAAPGTFLANAVVTLTLRETGASPATLTLRASGTLEGFPGLPGEVQWFAQLGSLPYTITGGTGRYAGATGTGELDIGFTDRGAAAGTVDFLHIDGTITTQP